jgi:hypothetical protein
VPVVAVEDAAVLQLGDEMLRQGTAAGFVAVLQLVGDVLYGVDREPVTGAAGMIDDEVTHGAQLFASLLSEADRRSNRKASAVPLSYGKA